MVVVWLLSGPAVAAEPADTPERYFAKAKKFSDERKYTEAIRTLEAGYAADPIPEYIFNMGRLYKAARRLAEARSAFQRYLKLAPNGRFRKEAEEQIKLLAGLVLPSNAAAPSAPVVQVAAPPLEAAPGPRTPDLRPRLRTVGWFFFSGGLATLTAGVVLLGLNGRECDRAPGQVACPNLPLDTRVPGLTVSVSGGALTAVGIALLGVGYSGRGR